MLADTSIKSLKLPNLHGEKRGIISNIENQSILINTMGNNLAGERAVVDPKWPMGSEGTESLVLIEQMMSTTPFKDICFLC